MTRLRLALYVLAGVLALLILWQFTAWRIGQIAVQDAEREAFFQSSQQVWKSAKTAYVAVSASLKASEGRRLSLERTRASEAARGLAARLQRDSLSQLLAGASTGLDSLPLLVAKVGVLEVENGSLREVIRLDSLSKLELVGQRDSLQVVLASTVVAGDSVASSAVAEHAAAHPKWLGFLPVPSRETVFVTGTTLGVVVTLLLAN